MTILGLKARLHGLWCLLAGHDVHWRARADDVCPGDIICHTCRCLHWCRRHDEVSFR
jgi:hypothetical protein